jgi:hypothetical protein
MDDEGLTILPSHRLIHRVPGFQLEPFIQMLSAWFDIEALPFPDSGFSRYTPFIKEKLEQLGRRNTVIAFYHHKGACCYLLSLKPGAGKLMGDDLHPSLKKLDVLVLSRFVLQKGLGFSREDLDNEEIFHYQSSLEEAVSTVDTGKDEMVFLLNPTKIDHVKEIARNFLVMPRKSTYFYPKILTGLVFNKIDPHETIQTF